MSKATLSGWLKEYPLKERTTKQRTAQANAAKSVRETRQRSFSYYPLNQLRDSAEMSNQQKGKIAESAVLLRLAILGYGVYGSSFDGDRYDWLVDVAGRIVRVQVRWAYQGRHGSPVVSIRRHIGNSRKNGRRRYDANDFDIIVGYDYDHDVCYVFSKEQCAGLGCTVSAIPSSVENWGVLRAVGVTGFEPATSATPLPRPKPD